MFVTGPPDVGGAGVCVRGALGRTFGDSTGQVLNPTMPGYVADLAAAHGIAVRTDLIERGAGHSYGEMCAPLLAELVSEDRPADLLVLATAAPDIRYGRATATYLSWQCAGAPLGFTVCDEGLLAAFTALRLIEGYAGTGGCRRAVLLVAEQPTQYYELPVPTPVPDRAAAVAVTLETDGAPGALSVSRRPATPPHQVPSALAAAVDRLTGTRAAPVVLVGTHLAGLLAGHPVAAEVLTCGENQPLTGLWLTMARDLAGWREDRSRVLLAEYDPARDHLVTAILDFAAR